MAHVRCFASFVIISLLSVLSFGLPFNTYKYYDDHKITQKNTHSDKLEIKRLFRLNETTGGVDKNNDEQNGIDFWLNGGLEELKSRLEIKATKRKAKNIILFLGDGMSVPTLAAARIYKGQRAGKTGEESFLSFEKFPFTGLSKTYCVDSQVADSACSATAYLTGVKGNIETIGVTGAVKKFDCEAMLDKFNQPSSIASWAHAAGKAIGLVTTTRVSHASPAGVYSHIAHRSWEYDGKVNESGSDPERCWDITKQLVLNEPGNHLKVILGGGRSTFIPETEKDPEYNTTGWRKDNRNLINEWLEDKKLRNLSAKFVWNRIDLVKAEYDKDTDYLLGLFEPGHMQYHMEANEMSEPTLEEMTEMAIKKLSKDKNGFFLFVEGGKIDLAHHYNFAEMAFDETIEFDKAIQKARQMTSTEDTLIVVTADHAHTMSFSGYPSRGSDILTTLQEGDMDHLPYSTISYANGPGYKQHMTEPSKRYDLTQDVLIMNTTRYMFPSLLPLTYETHGGDDVAVFASGPWAHLFVGNYEQNVIPLKMAYAARIGPSEKMPYSDEVVSGSQTNSINIYWLMIFYLGIILYQF